MNINDLGYECLENIFIHLSPYADLANCSQVCKLWNTTCKSALVYIKNNFKNGLVANKLICENLYVERDRRSHASCIVKDRLYLFGGTSGSKASFFNDLWQLNLSSYQWTRLAASGSFPKPKCKASMLFYDDQLIVYGGLVQISRPFGPGGFALFNQVDSYHLRDKIWTSMDGCGPSGPRSAGHSASIVNDSMIIFGGLREGSALPTACNELWIFNLKKKIWTLIHCQGQVPRSRYDHSQILLDSQNILILGGDDGEGRPYNCMWRLKLVGTKDSPDEMLENSLWIPIILRSNDNVSPIQPVIHRNQAVMMDDNIYLINKSIDSTRYFNQAAFTLHTIDISTLLTTGSACWLPSPSKPTFHAHHSLILDSIALAESEMILSSFHLPVINKRTSIPFSYLTSSPTTFSGFLILKAQPTTR